MSDPVHDVQDVQDVQDVHDVHDDHGSAGSFELVQVSLEFFYTFLLFYFFQGALNATFSMSSKESGIFLPIVSGTKIVIAPEMMAMTLKMRVGMAGWMSARAATVVERVPPILETSDEEPTPAARTVVGISSPVYM